MTPGFSPYAAPNMHMATAQSWQGRSHGVPETNSREPEWPAPQRSVSYSNLEGMQASNQHSAYGLPHPSDSYASARTRAPNGAMYPPNITTTHPHSAAEISSASTVGTAYTHSATPMSAGSYTSWNQPYTGGYAKVSPGIDTYASWNGAPGEERIVEEEESAGGYGGYGNSGGGVYYAGQPHAAGRQQNQKYIYIKKQHITDRGYDSGLLAHGIGYSSGIYRQVDIVNFAIGAKCERGNSEVDKDFWPTYDCKCNLIEDTHQQNEKHPFVYNGIWTQKVWEFLYSEHWAHHDAKRYEMDWI